jgi:hypothetical protein
MRAAIAMDLEEARLQLSEAFLGFWDQAQLIERLRREGKPTKRAEEPLALMQRTIEQLRHQVERLTDKAENAAADGNHTPK